MTKKIEVNEYTNRYIEIWTLFVSLFSLSRTLCGKMTKEIIEKLEIVLKQHFHIGEIHDYLKKIVKIHGIEDHILNQIIEYNGISCVIEDFNEQAHQFGMNDERKHSWYKR